MVGSTEPIIRPVTEREGIWSMIRCRPDTRQQQADAFPGGAPPGGTGRSPIPG
jgi:hypothetical protein